MLGIGHRRAGAEFPAGAALRADTARTSPGTGLGLSLVEATVRAHRGELWICSVSAHHRTMTRFDVPCDHPTHGTTITVLLPAAPPTAGVHPSSHPRTRPSSHRG
ncbi:ATP-binding protein [Micromonospora kangleipakensis]|uniref:ATP-binding protein n=1 Tax=Micromonospora kangleipakensis TaxID=1077942 RepID=UPI003BF7EDDA